MSTSEAAVTVGFYIPIYVETARCHPRVSRTQVVRMPEGKELVRAEKACSLELSWERLEDLMKWSLAFLSSGRPVWMSEE